LFLIKSIFSMKKIYLLSLLCCLLGMTAYAQPSTLTIYSTGASGAYITGYGSSGSRFPNTVYTTGTTWRGWAVFDLSTIPAGAIICNVTVGYNLTFVGGSGSGSGWATYGYPGDLSTVVTPATLFADMVAPAATLLDNVTPYGSSVGNWTIPTNSVMEGFVSAHAGSKISISFTGGGTRSYQMTGETGTATTTGAHAPYIQISYYLAPTGVTASAAPTTVCVGDNISLTAASTSGATDYAWAGPGGYVGTGATPTAAATSSGVYTVTAMNVCGIYTTAATATTSVVTVNPRPTGISITSPEPAICTGSTITVTDGTSGGTWSASPTTVGTVDAGGFVYGTTAGTLNVTYTLASTGCFTTMPVPVNDPPAAISGPSSVCVSNSVTLSDIMPGGTWGSSATGIATIDPSTGILLGSSSGNAYISYKITGCPATQITFTVNPTPAAISGTASVCQGFSTTLSDSDPGGAWSSSNSLIALVGTGSGLVFGASVGAATISYTLPTGCYNTVPVTINLVPVAFAGPPSVCASGSTITLSDATPGGGWLSSDPTVATVTSGGMVTGVGSGVTHITYTVGSCYYESPLTVYPLPAAISGAFAICQNTSTTLSDTDPGGTWSSSTPTVASIGTSSGSVSGVTPGGATITYTAVTGCTRTFPMTINAAPSATITAGGPTTFCAGGSVALNAPTGGGYTYQWLNGGVPISGATSSAITVSTTGPYAVTVTNALGCSATSAPTIVSAGLNPVITNTGSDSFCVGSHVLLGVNLGGAAGAATYQWKLNGVNIASATAPTYFASQPGVYSASVTVSGGSGTCSAITPGTTVTVFPVPTPSISFNGTAFSTANIYSSYQWFVNAVSIPGATSYAYIPTMNGSYRVLVGDVNNCTGYSAAYEVTTVGVKEINKADISVYPNPVTNMLHVTSPVSVRAVVSGIEGKTLIDQQDAHEIDMSGLANGVYVMMLYNDNGERVLVQKLIKE
jgi:trimeric autotransporter adhesin